MAKKYWVCVKCGDRWERTKQKCSSEKCAGKETAGKRPKKRVPKHARTLQNDPYPVYVEIAEKIHNVTDESCCACGRPKSLERRHDRDHDHKTGEPRGLLCVRHNKMLDSRCTPEELRGLAAYLQRVEDFYVASRRDPAGRDKTSKAME